MPTPRVQRYEVFTGGKNLAVEPQRVSPVQFEEGINWDIAQDGLPETAPGYFTEFTFDKRRQLSTMEDSEDSEWTGADLDADATNKNFAFQSRRHTLGASDSLKTAIFSPPAGFFGFTKTEFLDLDTNDSTNFKFWLFVTDVSEILSVEVRFKKDAGHYFFTTLTIPASDNSFAITTVSQGSFSVFGAPTLTWDEVLTMEVITTPIAANGATAASFDDFFVEDTEQSDPIVGIHSLELPAVGKKILVTATGDMIFSREGGVNIKRAARLGTQRPVHMETANDQVFAVNSIQRLLRWIPDDPAFREAGVPIPPAGMTGAGSATVGNVGAGDRSAKVTFDMGIHGEGNASVQTATFNVSGAETSILYSGLPIGPPGTIRRVIYRTFKGVNAAGEAVAEVGPWFFDRVVDNNVDLTAESLNSDNDLGDEVKIDGDQPPILSYLKEIDSKLYGVLTSSPSKIRHSDTTRLAGRTIEQWDPLNEIEIDPDDGDIITGLLKHKEFLYPFKRRSAFIVDAKNNIPSRISSVYGSMSQRVLVDAGEKAYLWSSRFGPLRLQGIRFQELGRNLRDKDGRPLGVVGLNDGTVVPITVTIPATREIDSQADWDLGTFVNTNSTEVVGSVKLNRGTGQVDKSKDFSTTANGASIVEAVSQVDTASLGPSPVASLIDGNTAVNSGRNYNHGGSVNLAKITLTITVTSETYNGFRLIFANGGGINRRITVEIKDGVSFVKVYDTDISGFPSAAFSESAGGPSRFIVNGQFAETTSTQLRVTFFGDRFGVTSQSFLYRIDEISLYRQDYQSNGTHETEDIDLGVIPTALNAISIDFDPGSGNVQVFMKSASTQPGLAAATYQLQINGIPPDPNVVAALRHVKFKSIFTATNVTSPELKRIALGFVTSDTQLKGTLHESSGIYFEGKFWANLVRRNEDVPAIMWKLGYFEEPTEHDDYRMSCWTIHDGVLFSGSAVDGRVYRHVRDDRGVRFTNKDGRPIICDFTTRDNPLGNRGEQMVEKTVLDFLVGTRNESEKFPELILNGSFEDSNLSNLGGGAAAAAFPLLTFIPSGWAVTSPPNQQNGRTVLQETEPRNTWHRQTSLVLDARVPGSEEVFVAQSINLENSTDYVLEFGCKTDGPPPEIVLTTADGLILAADGTWVALNTPPQMADTDGIFKLLKFNFQTIADIENRLPVELRFRYPGSTTVLQGRTYLDAVSLQKAQTRSRILTVQTIIDGVPIRPPKSIDLVDPRPGIVKGRGRIDRGGIRNIAYKFRTEGTDVGCKILGVLTAFSVERVRSNG